MQSDRRRDVKARANASELIKKGLQFATVGSLFLIAAFAPNSIAVTQSAWLLGMCFWLSRFLFFPRPPLERTPIDYALFGFFVLTGISAFLSYEPMVSIGKLRAASLFTIVYLVSQNVGSRRLLRLLVLTLVAGSAVNSLYTFGERAVGRGVKVLALQAGSPLYAAGVRAGDTILEVNQQKVSRPEDVVDGILTSDSRIANVRIYRHEWQPVLRVERTKVLPGDSALAQLGIDSWSRGRDWRASGFFGHYVTYAEALQLLIAIVFGLAVSIGWNLKVVRVLLFASLLLLIGALVLTVTRASWLAFLVSSAVVLSAGVKKRTLLVVGLLAIPLILAGVFILQQKRNVGFIDRNDGSTTWRETVWREGFELLTSKPRHLVVGIGMDTIKSHWRQWGLFDNGRLPIGHMHSNLLQLALERGIPTLVLWLLLLGVYAVVLVQLHARLKKSEDKNEVLGLWIDRGLVLGAFGGLIGFFVSGLVHYNWGDSEVVIIFYLLMGLTLALHRFNHSPAVSNR